MKKAVSQKILCFAREAGGAEALAPVCKALIKQGYDLLLLSKDFGKDIFSRESLRYIDFPTFSEKAVQKYVDERWQTIPDLIFTSATSLPWLDMTERYLWKWGNEKKCLTVGLLDQWQNYALRFSGTSEDEYLLYLPDYIFVMDELARKEMIREGIPDHKIIVTGQPAFDTIRAQCANFRPSLIAKKKKNVGLPPKTMVITFIAEYLEPLRGRIGYDEQKTMRFLGEFLECWAKRSDQVVHCLIKLHPQNTPEAFSWIRSQWPHVRIHIVQKELSPAETLAVSDLVIGMASVMLIEAILINKTVVSLQLGCKGKSQLAATKAGAIPFIKSETAARRLLSRLLSDLEYRKNYRKKATGWKLCRNNTARCITALRKIIGGAYHACAAGG